MVVAVPLHARGVIEFLRVLLAPRLLFVYALVGGGAARRWRQRRWRARRRERRERSPGEGSAVPGRGGTTREGDGDAS